MKLLEETNKEWEICLKKITPNIIIFFKTSAKEIWELQERSSRILHHIIHIA